MNEYTVIEKHDGWAEVVLLDLREKMPLCRPWPLRLQQRLMACPHSRTLLRLSFGGLMAPSARG